jgi:hypothetical protein
MLFDDTAKLQCYLSSHDNNSLLCEWLADNDLEKDNHNTCEGILLALTAKHGVKA